MLSRNNDILTIIYDEESKEGSYTQTGLNPRSSKGLTGFNFLSFNQFKGKGMSEKTCPWVQLLGLLLQKFPDYLCHRPCKLYSMDLTSLWSVECRPARIDFPDHPGDAQTPDIVMKQPGIDLLI